MVCLFHLNCEVFWRKIRKFVKLEKLENMKKQRGVLRTKHFNLLKRHLYQDGKAENIPVVARRLVVSTDGNFFRSEVCTLKHILEPTYFSSHQHIARTDLCNFFSINLILLGETLLQLCQLPVQPFSMNRVTFRSKVL